MSDRAEVLITVIPYKFLHNVSHFLKISNFYDHRKFSKFALLVQIWAQFTPWRSPKSKIVNSKIKKFIDRAIQISKNKGSIFPQFLMKIAITFCGIWWFFGQKGAQNSKIKRSKTKLAPHFRKPVNVFQLILKESRS